MKLGPIKCFKLAFLFLVVSLGLTVKNEAGECILETEQYLKLIENEHPAKLPYEISCLAEFVSYYAISGNEYLISLERMAEIRKSAEPYRDRVRRSLAPYLSSPDLRDRKTAAEVLAYYGWADGFDELSRDPSSNATFFAFMGDERAVPLIIARYRALPKGHRKINGESGGADVEYLNVLYHLGSMQSLPFIEEVLAGSARPKIKRCAKLVKARILSLHPEAISVPETSVTN